MLVWLVLTLLDDPNNSVYIHFMQLNRKCLDVSLKGLFKVWSFSTSAMHQKCTPFFSVNTQGAMHFNAYLSNLSGCCDLKIKYVSTSIKGISGYGPGSRDMGQQNHHQRSEKLPQVSLPHQLCIFADRIIFASIMSLWNCSESSIQHC